MLNGNTGHQNTENATLYRIRIQIRALDFLEQMIPFDQYTTANYEQINANLLCRNCIFKRPNLRRIYMYRFCEAIMIAGRQLYQSYLLDSFFLLFMENVIRLSVAFIAAHF